MKKVFFGIFVLLFSLSLQAQEESSMFKHALSVDMGGVGKIFTAEYQYEIISGPDWAFSMSVGMGLGGTCYSLPIGFNYIRGKTNQLFVGFHTMPFWNYDFDNCYNTSWYTLYTVSPRVGFRRPLKTVDGSTLFVHLYLSPLIFMNDPKFVMSGGFGFGWYFE